jgi:hypothetical protein
MRGSRIQTTTATGNGGSAGAAGWCSSLCNPLLQWRCSRTRISRPYTEIVSFVSALMEVTLNLQFAFDLKYKQSKCL